MSEPAQKEEMYVQCVSCLVILHRADPYDIFTLPTAKGSDHKRKEDDPIFEIGDESPEGQADPNAEGRSKFSVERAKSIRTGRALLPLTK